MVANCSPCPFTYHSILEERKKKETVGVRDGLVLLTDPKEGGFVTKQRGTKKLNRPAISLSKCEISLAKRGERDVIEDRKVEQIDGDSSFAVTGPGGEVVEAVEAVVAESLKNDVRAYQTLRAILTRLERAYCGSIGYEYMRIADREKCNWLREKIETPTPMQYNRQRHEVILDRLMWSTQFENFLATKWTAAKRFGLEGCETLIPGMKEMFDRSADLGVEIIVIGMSHRGRLNVLGNVVRKPLRQIFSEFSGGTKPVDEVGLYTGTCDDEGGGCPYPEYKSPLKMNSTERNINRRSKGIMESKNKTVTNGGSSFRMPLHYPRYTHQDYQDMPELMLDRLLADYGLPAAKHDGLSHNQETPSQWVPSSGLALIIHSSIRPSLPIFNLWK
ncbi:hypothetical protein RJ639_036728 [Escallonia herrerae]|uniref:DUF7722 domain-containing protein n=1 Tax=Escallonia herrerae TaxID=1293975 RepID=A0AA88WQE0_9ASTE|nr:hypothetical protein RJ639_036728 [Escallonia herrerae]